MRWLSPAGQGVILRTTRLVSACIQAIMAAEVGHTELAYDYLSETAFIDLRELAFNTRDGVHLASLAGCWLVAVAGFGGRRDHGTTLELSPRLPKQSERLRFRPTFRGRLLRVTVGRDDAGYELLEGGARDVGHHGERVTLGGSASSVSRPIPAATPRPRPVQLPGREPPLGASAR